MIEPASPEYTIVSAIDDSCVLFAVKEHSVQSVGDESGESSSMLQQSPMEHPKGFYDDLFA